MASGMPSAVFEGCISPNTACMLSHPLRVHHGSYAVALRMSVMMARKHEKQCIQKRAGGFMAVDGTKLGTEHSNDELAKQGKRAECQAQA
ncbi:hypothetical protein IHE31_08830 [Mycetohabitans rhizoxinica]|uniref:hypothetical protein n=1 Tax=Mycetohabitans rhizoxinica TaxID=412963 RepID=UPI0030D06CE5